MIRLHLFSARLRAHRGRELNEPPPLRPALFRLLLPVYPPPLRRFSSAGSLRSSRCGEPSGPPAIVGGYFSFRDPSPDPSRRFKVLLILDFTRPTDPGSDQSLIRDRSRNTLRMFIRGSGARGARPVRRRIRFSSARFPMTRRERCVSYPLHAQLMYEIIFLPRIHNTPFPSSSSSSKID